MSGWTDFTSFAKSALTTAQKKIDTVLDIRDEHPQKKSESSEFDETGSTSSSTIHKLQEDFFSAFGFQSSSSDSPKVLAEENDYFEKNETTTDAATTNVSEKSSAKWSSWLSGTVENVAKPKSSWASWLGPVPPSGQDEPPSSSGFLSQDTPSGDNEDDLISADKSQRRNDSSGSSITLHKDNYSIDLSGSNSTTTVVDESLSKESTQTSLKSSSTDNNGDNGNNGWCTESLVVPKDDEISPISADLLTPGDSVGFLPTGAQLELIDVDDNVVENFCEYDTITSEEGFSTHRPSPWYFSPQLNLDIESSNSSSGSNLKDGCYSNSVTPKATGSHTTEYLFASDSEKSLCTLVDRNCTSSSVDMSSSSKSQDTIVDESKDAVTIVAHPDAAYSSSNKLKSVLSNEYFSAEYADVVDEDMEHFYTESVADCVEGILSKVSDEFNSNVSSDENEELQNSSNNFCTILRPNSTANSSPDDEIAGHSLAESFVQLGETQNDGSPLLCQQKSETSSIVKGSGYSSPLEDIETNASSDIEIISTTNGDNASVSSSRSGISHLHSIALEGGYLKQTHRRVYSDQDVTDCYDQSAPHKKMSLNGIETDKTLQQLRELLEARERKLLEVSKENAQIADENDQLRRELQDVHNRISSTMTFDKSQKEQNERATVLERKLETVNKEKDALKRKCENLEKEVASRVSAQQFQQMLQEKEQQIQDLMQEGEKLSRTELKHNNIVKKLREKEKENEKTIESQRTKLLDMDNLKRKLRSKEEQELKYDEMVLDLKSTLEKQEKVVERLQSEHEDATVKCNSYKMTLENCAKEISELRKECATKDSEIQHLLSNVEESKQAELQDKLSYVTKQFQDEKQRLLKEIDSLKLFAGQNDDELQRRESSLRWEVNQLQQKLQEAEGRNQELADSIASATKPLLRQIDSLQLSFQTQQNNWERLEKSLYDRLGEAERKAQNSQEKEQTADQALNDIRVKLGHLEKQLSTITKEKEKLETSLTFAQRESQSAVAQQSRFAEELESEKSMQRKIIDELQKEKDMLSAQFEFEKSQIRHQLDKQLSELSAKLIEKENFIGSLQNQLIDNQRIQQQQHQHLQQTSSFDPKLPFNSPSSIFVRTNRSVSPSSASAIGVQDDPQDDLWSNDVSATGGYSSFVERMRSKLQQREGELSVLKEELKYVQNSRDAVAMSLISLSNEKQEAENKVQESMALREQHHRLDVNYQALLQMYGEKVEENEELKMDLADVKNLYKQQLDYLLNNKVSIDK